MKKRIAIIAIICVLLILLFPTKLSLKDGGTVEYKAILYSIVKKHSMGTEQSQDGYYIGTEVKILSFEVYNDVEFIPSTTDEINNS